MDEFEKVEKLRQRADVSYEDAKAALTAANGDLLDAMIYLEKQGKTEASKTTEYKSNGTEEKLLPACCEAKKDHKEKAKADGEKFKNFCKDAWKKGNDNEFVMRRKNEVLIKIPVWVLVLVLIFTFHVTLPLMLVSLFFGCKYAFEGKDDLSAANDAMNKVSDAAEKIKEDYFTKSEE